jgi:hypothetical protein
MMNMHPQLLTAGGAGLKAEPAHSCTAAQRPTYDAPRSIVHSPVSPTFRTADDVNCYIVMNDQSQNISHKSTSHLKSLAPER